MTNYKVRVGGLLPQGMTWSTGYNLVSTAALGTVSSTWNAAWNAMWTDATNGLEKFVPSGVTVINTTAYTMSNTWRVTGKDQRALALAGTDVNHISNIAAAPYISMTGATDNATDRGHIKLPPFGNDAIVDGLVTNACVTALGTVFQTLFTTMKALAGYQAVSYNRHANKLGDPPFTNHQLTNATMTNRCGTNRARQRKLKVTFTSAITL